MGVLLRFRDQLWIISAWSYDNHLQVFSTCLSTVLFTKHFHRFRTHKITRKKGSDGLNCPVDLMSGRCNSFTSAGFDYQIPSLITHLRYFECPLDAQFLKTLMLQIEGFSQIILIYLSRNALLNGRSYTNHLCIGLFTRASSIILKESNNNLLPARFISKQPQW